MYYQTFNSYVPYSPYEPSGEEYNYRSTTINSNRFFGLKEGFESGNILKQEYLPYKNHKVPSVTTNNEKDSLLVELMMKYDYMHDLNLILDIYPTDKESLALFLDMNLNQPKGFLNSSFNSCNVLHDRIILIISRFIFSTPSKIDMITKKVFYIMKK